MASKSLSSFRIVASRFCKATNCCNSAFTLYALLKRSGLNMTFLIVLDHHTTRAVGASGCWSERGSVDQWPTENRTYGTYSTYSPRPLNVNDRLRLGPLCSGSRGTLGSSREALVCRSRASSADRFAASLY